MVELSRLKQFIWVATFTLVLAGCQSTGSGHSSVVGPTTVGPTYKPAGSQNRFYPYDKGIYLDVAVPIFNPGLPKKNGEIDGEKVKEKNIWPEVRRLEAKRFAVNTRNAIDETKAFGAVLVSPDTSVSADLYVLGRISESTTQETVLDMRVVDATNRVWGQKDFELKVDSGFHRDQRNTGRDPNRVIYKKIAYWVYTLVNKRSVAELQNIKLVSDLRYANMYSPEAFGGYLEQKRTRRGTVFAAVGAPADSDDMLARVREYEAKDMDFVDNLQAEYDQFYGQTTEAYRTYQKETLAIIEDIEEKRTERNANAVLGILGVVAAVAAGNQETHTGDVLAVASGVLAAGAFLEMVRDNSAVGDFQEVYEEMGQNLDLQISPQVRVFEGREIELTGTAKEQYQQWRAHLQQIYRETETPDIQL